MQVGYNYIVKPFYNLYLTYYNIAGLNISINSINPVATQKLLPPFQPFAVEGFEDKEYLFQMNADRKIDLPKCEVTDVLCVNGVNSDVYSQPDGYTICTKIGALEYRMFANPSWEKIDINASFVHEQELPFIHQFLMCAFGVAAAKYNALKIHASVIEKDGKALIFLGVSGTGKSTHSKLWLRHIPGCSLLNDDEPIVRIENDVVKVYGSPWSGKTPCYRNVSAKVSAFVHLSQYPENKLSKLTGLQAFMSVFQSASVLRSDEENRQLVFNTVTDVLQQIPVYRLDCRADEEAVRLTETLL